MLAVVFGGGNALGAYHGGVVEALEADDVRAGWVAGSSIGAVTAALVAGTEPGRRVSALREFWRRGAQQDGFAYWIPEPLRKPLHLTAALGARLAGRPLLFRPRVGELIGGDGNPGLYDAGPMRRTLRELIDFDLLNSGSVRFACLAVDVETGAEVAFDTARERIEVDHVMASAALPPDFPAVEIGGRSLVDGGLAANTPADLVLAEHQTEPLACFTADLFPLAAPRPRRLGDAAERQSDLVFACQTARTLTAMRRLWQASDPGVPGAVYCLNYAYQEGEVAVKSYDFAQTSLDRRWTQGRQDMASALQLWRTQPPGSPGLHVHNVAGALQPEPA